MSSFTNALILKKKKKREWEVLQSFTYEVGHLGSGESIEVPAGFVSDLASVPRIFWPFLPPDGDYSQAAVLHDWLCIRKGNVERNVKHLELMLTKAFFTTALTTQQAKQISNCIVAGNAYAV